MTIVPRFRALPVFLFCLMFWATLPATAAAQQCQPGIDAAWEMYRSNYDRLWGGLVPNVSTLTGLLNAVSNESTYHSLVAAARSIAASYGRLVVTLPDGTVVVDTSHPDGDTPENANSWAHFVSKSINENHNTQVAIMAAQMFPCGVAIETKPFDATGVGESQLAARLGPHLSSVGTARLSLGFSVWDY